MAYILKDENAVYYECNYSCDNQLYLNLNGENFLFTDARYAIDAKLNAKNCEVCITDDLIKEVRKKLKKSKIKKLIFDPYDFNIATFSKLSKNLDIKFIKKEKFSQKKRIIKDDYEIKLLKKAMVGGRVGFVKFQKYLQNKGIGKTEQHLAFKAQTFLTMFGKYDLSFTPIIAIDENSAKPHATPSDKLYKKNNMLLFDGGIKYKRYCSDRTVTFGNNLNNNSIMQREQKFKNKKQQKIYDIVLKAQQTAIKKAKVGMIASQIDKIARDIISKAGYEKYFVHSTGHGVGLDIHEYPIISSRSKAIIKENMVFTIEPGIYLPDNFGVRIEDTVVMQNGKAVIL